MKRVFKYPIERMSDVVEIVMPVGADILCVQTQGQGSIPTIWAIVDDEVDAPPMARVFRIAGTGHDLSIDVDGRCMEFPSKENYVGTFQIGGTYNKLVFHLFDLGYKTSVD